MKQKTQNKIEIFLAAGIILMMTFSNGVAQEPTAEDAFNLPVGEIAPTDNELDEAQAELLREQEEQEAFEKVREKALKQTERGLFPLKPEEIEAMLRIFNETREVGEVGEKPVPKPEIKVASLSLDPSVPPEVVKTAPGHVTSLTILDVTGRPWPIQDVSWGGDFDVIPPEQSGHVVRITPSSAHGFGNMSIRLIDLATPVTLTLRTSPDVVHYRFDARVPEFGPNASVPIIQGEDLTAGGATLTAVLDGTPPPEAERLAVSGVDGRTSVWRVAGQTYVRSPFALLSPAWTSSARSSDGMNVYTIGNAPVLLLSDSGTMVRAFIGKEEIDNDNE